MQATHLATKYEHTLAHIFQQPTSHTLEWREVITLMQHLGIVEERGSGHLVFTVKEVSQSFHRTDAKEVSEEEQVLELRDFLEQVGIGENGPVVTEVIDPAVGLRLLVVVSQKETRVFRSEGKGAVPEYIHPDDPHHVLHYVNHSKGGDLGSRSPENLTYYEKIAATLTDAEEILLMGHGTGASNAMTHLNDFLATHHKTIANHVVGTLTLDIEAMTEGQLLQEARAFFQTREAHS